MTRYTVTVQLDYESEDDDVDEYDLLASIAHVLNITNLDHVQANGVRVDCVSVNVEDL